MAKKPKDFDFDAGTEFEDFESEFGNMDFGDTTESDSSKSRTPIEKVKSHMTDGLTSAVKNVGPTLTSRLNRELPNTTALASEGMQFASDAKMMKDKFVQDVTPAINQLKKAGRTLAPKFKGYLPNKVQQKLDKFLAPAESWSAPSLEETRNQSISSNLDMVFGAQINQQEKIAEEDRTERFVDRSLASGRHKELAGVQDAIRVATEFQANYTKTVNTAYLKKSLELKYKHLFVAQDTLAVVQGLSKLTETKLDQIRHNTALPDIQKQQLLETYKSVAMEGLSQKVSSKFQGWFKQILTNVQEKVLDPVKSGLEMAGGMGEMYADFSQMEEDLGGKPAGFSPTSFIAKQAGSLLSSKLVSKAANKLFGVDNAKGLISPYASNLEDSMQTLKFRLMLAAQEKADSADYGPGGFLWSLLSPNINRQAGSIKNELNEPLKPATYDVATRTSIVEIIPGYLSKILQQMTRLSTGKDAEELVFDTSKMDFVTASVFKKDKYTKIFGTEEERGRKLGNVVGVLRGATAHVGENIRKFDRAAGDISKVLVNAITAKYVMYPDIIKKWLDDEDLTAQNDEYIDAIFKGIDDKKTVATALVAALYRDEETVNKQALNEINRYIIGMMVDEKHLDLLPSELRAFGNSRHLSEMVDSSSSRYSFKRDFIRQEMLKGEYQALKKGVEESTDTTKRFLDQDVQDKKDRHTAYKEAWDAMEKVSGNATITDVNNKFIPKYRARFKNPLAGPSESGLIPTQAAAIGAIPTSKNTSAISDQMILSGTRIVLPVHLTSSDVELSHSRDLIKHIRESNNYNNTNTPPTVSSSTNKLIEDFAERQFPVPDYLEKISTSTMEMNEKLLSLIALSGSWIGNTWHNGKQWTSAKFKALWSGGKTLTGKVAGALGAGLSYLPGASTGLFGTMVGAGALGMAGTMGMANWVGNGISDRYLAAKNKYKSMMGSLQETLASPKKYIEEQKLKMSEKLLKVKEAFKNRMTNTKNKFKDKLSWRYVDVYKKDQVELGKPLLSKKQQEEGLVFSDGSRVRTSYAITKPIVHPETKQTLITQEDIDHGLVDADNKSISPTHGFGLVGRAVGGAFKFLTSPSKLLKNLKMPGLSALGSPFGMMQALLTGGFGIGNTLLKGVGGLWKSVVDRNPNFGKDLKRYVGDKLDLIYKLLSDRLPNTDSSSPGDRDGDGKRDSAYEEYLAGESDDKAKQAEKSEKLKSGRFERFLGRLDKMFTMEQKTEKEQLDAMKNMEGGSGGFLENMLGGIVGGKLSGWLSKIPGVGKLTGMLSRVPGLGGLLSKAPALSGILGGGGLLSGAGASTAAAATEVATTTALASTATAAATGTATAATAAAAGSTASGAIAASLASNPVGWIIGGALLVGGGAYLGYRYLNPSADELTELRAKFYGIDLTKDRGFFAKSMTKKMFELEEETEKMFRGKSKPMTDSDLKDWADVFGFSPKDKDQVMYFATWYRQRFVPVCRVFTDLISKLGKTYDNVDDLSEDERSAVASELQRQVKSKVGEYQNLVPDMEHFRLFTQKYKEAKSDLVNNKPLSEQEIKSTLDDREASKSTTNNSKEFRNDIAASVAANRMSLDSDKDDMFTSNARLPKKERSWIDRTFGADTDSTSEPDVENYKDVSPKSTRAPLPDSKELGSLSAKYESGGKSSMAVGYDGTGGTSYGKYQIASKVGTFKSFLSWLKKKGGTAAEIADRLARAGESNTGSTGGAVPEEWKKIVQEGKMGDLEHQFIKETHYDIAYKGVTSEFQDMIGKSKALQQVLWSTAVHHGPGGASSIFNNVFKRTQNRTPEELIKAIYKERGGQFGGSSPKTRASVQSRFIEESQLALGMVGKDNIPTDEEKTELASAAPTSPDSGTAAPSTPSTSTPTTTAAVTETPKSSSPVITNNDSMGMSPSNMSKSVANPVSMETPVTTPTTTKTDSGAVANPELEQLRAINAGIQATNTILQSIYIAQGKGAGIVPGVQDSDMSGTGSTAPTPISTSDNVNLRKPTPQVDIPRYNSQVSVQRTSV